MSDGRFCHGTRFTFESASTGSTHETAHGGHLCYDFCDMLTKCIVGCTTFGHMACQHLAVHEAAAGYPETFSVCSFYEQAFDVPIAFVTFAQGAIMAYHQLGAFGLVAVAHLARTVVTFKQAFSDGCHALHGVLETIEIVEFERQQIACGKRFHLLQELIPVSAIF